MGGGIKELSQYRFRRACEDYETAQLLLKSRNLKASVNRSYYAIFHALRAVTALDQFEFKQTFWGYCLYQSKLCKRRDI